MSKLLPVLSVIFLLGCACAQSELEQSECEAVEDCPNAGSSVLQVVARSESLAGLSAAVIQEEQGESTEFSFFMDQAMEEDGESEADGESEEDLEREGAKVVMHAGVKLIVHDDSKVATTGRGTWVITIPDGCNATLLKDLAEHIPAGAVPEFEGHPEEGGLCVFMMTGTMDDVKEELSKHAWVSKPIVETDRVWHETPELDKDDDGGAHGEPALLEEGGDDVQTDPPSWGLDRLDDHRAMGLDQKYSPSAVYKGAEGVHIFVASTGIRTTHKDFGGRAIPTLEIVDYIPKECAGDTSCADDKNGHGTHSAALVGGTKYGVAKKATLHAVKIVGDDGAGEFSWLLMALDWVMRKKKASGGIEGIPAVFTTSLSEKGEIASVSAAIDAAVNMRVTVVVAAGHYWQESKTACGTTPAFVNSAITVGATNSKDKRAWFSAYGACVDIFAPGQDVVSAGIRSDVDEVKMSGTSLAAAHVAGAVALILAENIWRDSYQVYQAMVRRATTGTVTDAGVGSPNRIVYTGPFVDPTPAPTPAPQAVVCSFEQPNFGGACAMWHNEVCRDCASKDAFDWTRGTGSTSTPGTGPSKAFDGSYYMYLQSQARHKGEFAVLRSGVITIPKPTTLKFAYHMRGGDGFLGVWVGHKRMWAKLGDKGDRWHTATVDLSSLATPFPTSIFFVGQRQTTPCDIAIDKIELDPPPNLVR